MPRAATWVPGVWPGLALVVVAGLVTWLLHLAGWGKPSGPRPEAHWHGRRRDTAAPPIHRPGGQKFECATRPRLAAFSVCSAGPLGRIGNGRVCGPQWNVEKDQH